MRALLILSLLAAVAIFAALRYDILDSELVDEPTEGEAIDPTLSAIKEADKIEDPLNRCLKYPQISGVEWSRAMIESACNDAFAPVVNHRQIVGYINRGEADKLDRLFDGLVHSYFEGSLAEWALWASYVDHFRNDKGMTRKLARDWQSQSPNSPHAHVAMGLHHLAAGEVARGGYVAREVPEDDFERMYSHLEVSAVELESGLRLNPKIMPAYSALIQNAKISENDELALSAYERAKEVDPKTFYVRASMVDSREPRWGGSYEEMFLIAVNAQAFLDENPRMPKLLAMVHGKMAHDIYFYESGPSDVAAMEHFEEGLRFGPVQQVLDFAADTASDLGDNIRSFEIYSQMLRFHPEWSRIRKSRAWILSDLQERDWAMSEIRRVLSDSPNDDWALGYYAWLLNVAGEYELAAKYYAQLIALDQSDYQTKQALARVYLYKLRRFELAKPLIENLLEYNSESGAYWLMQTDFLRNTGRSGAEDAARMFLQYADESVEIQRSAIPKVQRWLEARGRADQNRVD